MSSSRGFENGPAGMGAETTDPCNLGFAALFLVSGALEVGDSTEHPNREPGIFGDPLGLNQYNEEMRLKGLNNGRFAMCAAIGIISADHYIGKDATEQFGLAATGTMKGSRPWGALISGSIPLCTCSPQQSHGVHVMSPLSWAQWSHLNFSTP